jgi:methyltransferase (TIGR00027 family)
MSAVVTWEEDYETRINPGLITSLLHAAVPLLAELGWRATRVEEGACESELPLRQESTNHHGTHLGALMALTADYTGGLALASVLRGVPVAGIHPGTPTTTASVWLAAMSVRHRAPSTGDLTASCTIPATTARHIRDRYLAGARIVVPVTVELRSNGETVAEAEMTYFAQPTAALTPTAERPRVSTLYKHKLKASARLIAALRGRKSRRFHCPHSALAAGPHGHLLADYMTGVLPQLEEMVLARTVHIDEVVVAALERGVRQIVTPGVGLDFRAFRLAERFPDAVFYETDLAAMLDERERAIRSLELPPARRVTAPVNFDTDRLDEAMTRMGFDAQEPCVVVYEGCSMYFDEATNRRTLGQIRRLMEHRESALWSDFVETSVLDRGMALPGIAPFLDGMERLGEAFVFGLDEPGPFFARLGFRVRDTVTSRQCLDSEDPIHAVYKFVVASPG